MKLRTQLLSFILGVVIIGFLVMLFFSYKSSRDVVLSEIFSKAQALNLMYRAELDGYFVSAQKVAVGLAEAVESVDIITESEIHELLKQTLHSNPDIYGMTIFFEPEPHEIGKKLFAPYYSHEGDSLKHVPARPTFNFQVQDWYRLPKETGLPVWTEPYFDKGANVMMTTFAVPIYKGKKFVGISTIDIGLDALSKKINSIRVCDNGYALLVSKKGVFLSHPNSAEYVLKKKIQDDFKGLAEEMLAGREGTISILDPVTMKKSWVAYTNVPSTSYSLAIIVPEDELLLSVNKLSRKMLGVGLAIILLTIVAVAFISLRVTTPLWSLSQSARKIADGDFEAEVIGSNSKNEIGDLTRDIQTMVSTIKQMYISVREKKEKFESVFINMSDGVFITDKDWNVLECNHTAGQMWGVSVGMNLLQHVSDHFHGNFQIKDLLDIRIREKRLELVRSKTGENGMAIYSVVVNSVDSKKGLGLEHIWTVRDITKC